MGTISSTAARVLVACLGAITLAIGARLAYTSYVSEKVLQQCLSGGSCPLSLSGIDLQSAYSATRGELFLGVGLVAVAIIAMMYSFLFAGGYSKLSLAKN